MNGQLQYKAGLDISEFTKTRDQLKKDLADLAKAGAAVKPVTLDTKPISNYQQAQLALQKSLADARVEVQRLIQVNQALKNELEQGKIAAQASRSEVERLKIAEQELKNAFAQGKIGLQEYNKQVQANKVAQGELNQKLTEAAIKDKQAAAALKEHNLQQKQLASAAKEARAANVALSGSYNAAQARLKELGARIKGVQDGFEKMTPAMRRKIKEYNELNDKLKAFDAQMGNHQRNVGNYKSALQGVGNDLLGLGAGFLSAQAALAGLTSVIRTNAEISDSLADVRRTAGLTAIEAENLAEQLKKIDTRTSLKGLLEISAIGGQVGIAKDQLVGFTKAVDELAVSLGSELKGGAEGIAKSLGVLDTIFGITQSNAGDVEKSLNQIGSAILGLGQSGLATGDFLSDFSERVGGVAKQAGLSLPVILSYGAVLQENGVNAEVAGTSFKKLISLLATRRNDFYTIAKFADGNLTMKEFTDTINNDTQKALGLFFNGLQKGGTKTTAFMDILQATGLAMGGVSQTVAALSSHQVELNSHISDATKDFNEATKSAEQFAIKNDNLAASMEKFSNDIGNMVTDGGLSTFFKQGVDGAREFLVYLNKLVNSQSWREFGIRLRGGDASAFDKANSLKVGLEKNSSVAFNNSNDRYLYKRDADALKKSFIETKDAAIDATVKYNTFKNAIQTGQLKDDGSLIDYKRTADILVQQANDLAKVYQAARDKAFKERKNKPKEEEVEFSLNDKKAKKSADKEARAQETALNRQRTLQAEIDALTRKGVASKEAADQQEIVSVEEKYRKLRDKAIAFNNAKDSRGNKVNLSGLNAAEAEEKQEIRYKAEAKVLKTSLDEQAKYYAEFEDLKTKIGEDKAKDRYANLIDVDRTYLESLEAQYDQLTQGKAKGGSENEADANPFAMKLLNEQIAAAKIVEQKAQDDLLADFLSYQEKRKVLTEKYNKQMLLLGDDAESKALRTEQYQTELDALDDAIAKKLDSFKALFEGVDRLSDENARKVVSDAEDMLNALMASGKISKELAKEIRTLLGNTKREIAERMPERIINLANQIDRVAEAVSGVDEGFGKLLSTVGNVVGQVGNIKKGMLDLKDAQGKGDVMGQLSAGLGIFGAGMSIFSSITKLFDNSAQREEQAAYARDLQNSQIEAMNKALERQISLINDAYGTERITKYNEAITKAKTDELKYQQMLEGRYSKTGNKFVDDIFARANAGDRNALGGIKNLKDLEQFKLPSGLKELQRLLDEDLLDAGTAIIVTNLIEANRAARDLQNNLNAERVGSSLDNIADSFVDALTDGTKDFGKTFEDIIKTSILNGFKGQLIEKQLQPFYDRYAEFAKDGLTKDEIEKLQAMRDQILIDGKKELENLERVTGVNLTDGGNSSSNERGITSSIKNIKQESANTLNSILCQD